MPLLLPISLLKTARAVASRQSFQFRFSFANEFCYSPDKNVEPLQVPISIPESSTLDDFKADLEEITAIPRKDQALCKFGLNNRAKQLTTSNSALTLYELKYVPFSST